MPSHIMQLYPRGEFRWLRLVFLPFMTYAAVALPLAMLIPAIDSFHHNNWNLSRVLPGYLICFCVLIPGGMVQLGCGRKMDAAVSIAFGAASYFIYTRQWFHF